MNSLYLFVAPFSRHVGKVKIGISDSPSRRRKEVACALKCGVYGFGLPLPFAKRIEQGLHAFYTWWKLHCKDMPDHSGRTEWFRIINPVTMLLTSLYIWVNPVGYWESVAYPFIALAFPLPFDVAISVLLLAVALLFFLDFLAPGVAALIHLACLQIKLWFFSFLN